MSGRRSEAQKLQAEAGAIRALRSGATVSQKTAADALRVGIGRMRLAVKAGEVAAIAVSGEVRVCSAPLLRALGLDADAKFGAANGESDP